MVPWRPIIVFVVDDEAFVEVVFLACGVDGAQCREDPLGHDLAQCNRSVMFRHGVFMVHTGKEDLCGEGYLFSVQKATPTRSACASRPSGATLASCAGYAAVLSPRPGTRRDQTSLTSTHGTASARTSAPSSARRAAKDTDPAMCVPVPHHHGGKEPGTLRRCKAKR